MANDMTVALTSGQRLQGVRSQRIRTNFAERQAYVQSSTIDMKIPSDTAIKRAILVVRGSFRVTYAAGSPVADETGFIGRIINRIECVEGNDTFKAIHPAIARRLSKMLNGQALRRAYATSASTPTSELPTTECPESGPAFVYPATTQTVYFEEAMAVDFEDPFAYGFGKQASIWVTKGKQNCRFRITTGSLASLQRDESSPVSITYDQLNINMSLVLVESPNVEEPSGRPFPVYKESLIPVLLQAGAGGQSFELPKGGIYLGAALLVRNSSVNHTLSDTAVRNWKITGNGERDFLNSDFKELQMFNEDWIGQVGNNMVASKRALTGFAYANFRLDGDISGSGIPSLDLSNLISYWDTRGPSDGDAETGPFTILLALQELRLRSV
jgi:hypothetical protein